MNEIVATNGTEQMASTLIGITCIVIAMLVVLAYRKLNSYERFKKIFDKIGLNSEFAKEFLTDIKNESTSVAKKQGIRKVREENIHVLDDVNIDTIAKYENKAKEASERKLERNNHDQCSDREDNGREIQASVGGGDSSTSNEPNERTQPRDA